MFCFKQLPPKSAVIFELWFHVSFGAKLLLGVLRGLILSSGDLLVSYAIIFFSITSWHSERIRYPSKYQIMFWSILTKVSSSIKISLIKRLKFFYFFLYFYWVYQEQCLLDFYYKAFCFLFHSCIKSYF